MSHCSSHCGLVYAGSANVQFQRLDISDKASVEEFGKWAESELKTVNVLVNNAGLALSVFR